jgi:hypothetical protein
MVTRLQWIAEVSLRRVLEMCTALFVGGRTEGGEPKQKVTLFWSEPSDLRISVF